MVTNKRKLTKKQKLAYLTTLSHVMHIDREIAEEEIEFLENQSIELGGISDEEFEKAIEKTNSKNVVSTLKAIKDIKSKRFILREMIALAIADHELDDNEVELIYNIGIEIGVEEDKISDMFMWAAKGVEWRLQGNRLIEEDL
jgi:uncharacterized tellurite resistance protein B-like protein